MCLTPVHCQFERGPLKLDRSIDAQPPSLRGSAKLILSRDEAVKLDMPMQVAAYSDCRLNLTVRGTLRVTPNWSAGAMPRQVRGSWRDLLGLAHRP